MNETTEPSSTPLSDVKSSPKAKAERTSAVVLDSKERPPPIPPELGSHRAKLKLKVASILHRRSQSPDPRTHSASPGKREPGYTSSNAGGSSGNQDVESQLSSIAELGVQDISLPPTLGSIPAERRMVPLGALHKMDRVIGEDAQVVIQSSEVAEETSISELWNQAYEALRETDPKLVLRYEECLSSTMSTMVGMTVTFSGIGKLQRQQQMEALLRKKIEEDKERNWSIPFGNDRIAVRDLAEPVVGIIDWVQGFVADALKSSPYGSIAWAGVCLLLPVSNLIFDSIFPYKKK